GQERPPSVRWLNAGAAGQAVLAAAATCVLVAGARRPGWRRGAVLVEVLIVLVAFGWFFLTAWLQRRALPRPGRPHRSGRMPGGVLALRDGADLGDGLGGHGDNAVGGTDADGTGWPADQRAAPGLAGAGGDGDSSGGAGRWPPARE